MKKILYISSFLLFFAVACKNEEKETPMAENDVDAVRSFVQAALEGNYDKAKTFMLLDSTNIDRMKMIQAVNLQPEEKKGLATATINVHETKRVNDSTTIVIFSNSFWKNWDTLKAVRQGQRWVVDFNYLFEHRADTLWNKKDSINK